MQKYVGAIDQLMARLENDIELREQSDNESEKFAMRTAAMEALLDALESARDEFKSDWESAS